METEPINSKKFSGFKKNHKMYGHSLASKIHFQFQSFPILSKTTRYHVYKKKCLSKKQNSQKKIIFGYNPWKVIGQTQKFKRFPLKIFWDQKCLITRVVFLI